MKTRFRLTAATAALACTAAVGVAASGTAAPGAPVADASAVKITKKGVGAVKLGKRHSALRKQGLVGKRTTGCELAGPGTHAARLKAPLEGGVDYRKTKPAKVKAITITGGAEARGVGIGDRKRDVKDAYGKVKVERGTEEVFGITLVTVPKKRGGKITFGIDTDSKRISVIGVPVIPFCD